MKIIQPVDVTPGVLISSNVPEDEHPEWEAGTYTQGYQCIYNHHVYEVLAETTEDSPEEGEAKSLATWQNTGATNRWRMFDDKVGTLTERPGAIEVVLVPGTVVNAVALFNLQGVSATVTVEDPTDGVVYHKVVSLLDAAVDNWYDWFFSPVPRKTDFVLLDLPAYGTAVVTVTVDNPDGVAAVGHMVIGYQTQIGVALYNTSVGITDFSLKSTDKFGNTSVVPRAFSKRAEFDVEVDTYEVSAVQRLLAGIRSRPVVWIGEETYEATILFGYYRDFSISFSGPSISDATITVEGFV